MSNENVPLTSLNVHSSCSQCGLLHKAQVNSRFTISEDEMSHFNGKKRFKVIVGKTRPFSGKFAMRTL